MAVVIRLARCGSTHRPKYRVTVADSRMPIKGRYLEVVGSFNPMPSGQDVKLRLKMDRIQDWVSKGAKPTKRVQSLMRKAQETSN